MLFSSRKNDGLVLILDVQSSIVRSALILEKTGGNPHILYTSSVPVSYRKSVDSRTIISATVKATTHTIDGVMRFLYKRNGAPCEGTSNDLIRLPRKISAVHYILSSPWILSEAKRSDSTFDKEETITHDMVFKMIRDERERLAAEVKASDKTTVVEEKIFNVELNGYPISNWQGKMAKSLSVSFVTSISGTRMVERFKEMCAHIVHGHDVYFHSSLLMQHIGIGQIFPDKDTYAILHIHGEITDIIEIGKHACTFFGTYPIGTQTVVRAFARAGRIGIHAAESSLNLHGTSMLVEKTGKNALHIKKAYEPWLEQLDRSLKIGHIDVDAPTEVIVGAMERQNDFVELLKQRYPKMKVEILKIEEVASHVTFESTAEIQVMLSLYAIAADLLRPM